MNVIWDFQFLGQNVAKAPVTLMLLCEPNTVLSIEKSAENCKARQCKRNSRINTKPAVLTVFLIFTCNSVNTYLCQISMELSCRIARVPQNLSSTYHSGCGAAIAFTQVSTYSGEKMSCQRGSLLPALASPEAWSSQEKVLLDRQLMTAFSRNSAKAKITARNIQCRSF